MRVTILTYGSLGDAQPFVAVGRGLADAGHTVRIVSHAAFEPMVRGRGLDFFPVQGDPFEILTSDPGRQWQGMGRNPVRFTRGLVRSIESILFSIGQQSLRACEDSDVIVGSILGLFAGRHIAEKLRVPFIMAPDTPMHYTAAFPSALDPFQRKLGPLYNGSTHLVAAHVVWQVLRRSLNNLRRDVFDLPAMPFLGLAQEVLRQRWPTLYSYSPEVFPRPREWGQRIQVTGYWFLDRQQDWTPPDDLVAFLGDGPPPVYIGLGSMRLPDPAATTAIVLRALSQTGDRAVLLTGPGALSQLDLPEGVFGITSCPHDWLFPRMSAVVHHGGAGTTAAGLRAGKPSVVLPFFADQPFWGWRVNRLGAGPPPIPFRRLTVARLVDAIQAAKGPQARRAAAEIGARIRCENGVETAVEAFARFVA